MTQQGKGGDSKGEKTCLEVTENDTTFDYVDSKSAGNAGTAVQVQEEVAVLGVTSPTLF